MAPKRIPKTMDRKILKMRSEGLTQTQIAKNLGVSQQYISKVIGINLTTDNAIEQHLRSVIRDQNKNYGDALKEIQRLNQQLSIIHSFNEYAKFFSPVDIKRRSNKRGEAVAFINIGDWHIDEVVEESAVNGLNKFNLDIAGERQQILWESGLSLVEMCRSRSVIDTIIIPILGDMISGWIHEPLMVSNSITPPEAILRLFDYLVSGINFMAKESGAEEIIIAPVCGNHGRITRKKYDKKSVTTNYEWILYQFLARYFVNNRKVRFKLPHGDVNMIKVYDNDIRITHGDNVIYQGGTGGVHIPLRRAIDNWNTGIQADFNIVGHWHSYQMGEDYLVNGSLIGYSEFNIRKKLRYQRPMQSFFIMHPRYGPTAQFRILLGD